MRFFTQPGRLGIVCVVALWGSAIPAAAQLQLSSDRSKAQPPKISRTELQFELLTAGRGNTALAAQEWGRIFQGLGVPLRIRPAILDDKPEIDEQRLGTIRRVVVIGVLTSDSRIAFPGGHRFSQAETAQLAEWIRELKTYGAQGAPEGKPAFGLNETQFSEVYAALSQPVANEVRDLELEAAMAKLELPKKYPLRFTTTAEDQLRNGPDRFPVRETLKGFSKGTALAALLNEYGLGFRPLRTPSGSIEIVVHSFAETDDRWPVGWPPDPEKPRLQIAPNLFKIVPVELEEVPLQDVLDAVSKAADIPILIDYHRLETKGVDLRKLKVSYPARKTMWSLLLKSVTTPNLLTRELLVDEAGRGFVWVTTLEVERLRR